jgi:hypothetical protein
MQVNKSGDAYAAVAEKISIGLPLVKSARTNEKRAVKIPMTASLLIVSWIEYRTTIEAIGKVEAIVVATILEIPSSPVWE